VEVSKHGKMCVEGSKDETKMPRKNGKKKETNS
jgi:hypothetical protein